MMYGEHVGTLVDARHDHQEQNWEQKWQTTYNNTNQILFVDEFIAKPVDDIKESARRKFSKCASWSFSHGLVVTSCQV